MNRLPLLLLLLCLAAPAANAGATDPAYHIEISKSHNELAVFHGNELVARYHVAFGKGGAGAKRRVGDGRTPVGTYRIVEFKPDSRFYFFMQINYPNLLDAWHGYSDGVISAREFRAIATAYSTGDVPPQNTALGGYIGIHGIGDVSEERLQVHEFQNWTEGCIAVTDREISELRSYVSVGTKVVIHE